MSFYRSDKALHFRLWWWWNWTVLRGLVYRGLMRVTSFSKQVFPSFTSISFFWKKVCVIPFVSILRFVFGPFSGLFGAHQIWWDICPLSNHVDCPYIWCCNGHHSNHSIPFLWFVTLYCVECAFPFSIGMSTPFLLPSDGPVLSLQHFWIWYVFSSLTFTPFWIRARAVVLHFGLLPQTLLVVFCVGLCPRNGGSCLVFPPILWLFSHCPLLFAHPLNLVLVLMPFFWFF